MHLNRIAVYITIITMLMGVSACANPGFGNKNQTGSDEAFEIMYEARSLEDDDSVINKESLLDIAIVMEQLIVKAGKEKPEISIAGDNRIRVSLSESNGDELNEIKEVINKSFTLNLRNSKGVIEMDRYDFTRNQARVVYDFDNNPGVVTDFTDAAKFEELTTRLMGQSVTINMGDFELTQLLINAPITEGTALITAQSTYDQAKDLARMINVGALPFELKELTRKR
ncbi:SecDF P1 head subdomain-containing protein [Paenibacillus paeoniae]|uniref:SecDF P1 head subdomain domain-containing protein n=1 Tax=Paenibacillus paeoniae TaxID=2292705 RepID=A0A371PJ80_9BACL|nr:hypothetical protein [Paenibacillus paeoniae]REK76203.1 hypothetical protein DX130_03855 [Paenibacillus paeoniae]